MLENSCLLSNPPLMFIKIYVELMCCFAIQGIILSIVVIVAQLLGIFMAVFQVLYSTTKARYAMLVNRDQCTPIHIFTQ